MKNIPLSSSVAVWVVLWAALTILGGNVAAQSIERCSNATCDEDGIGSDISNSVQVEGHLMCEEAMRTFAERFDAIFDGPNLNIADDIFASDFVGHAPLAPVLDRDGWKDYVASFYAGMSDLSEEGNEVILSEDRLVLHVTYTGTHDGTLFGIPATGKPVTIDGIGIFRFDENGRAIENWAVVDVVGILTQIGAFSLAQ